MNRVLVVAVVLGAGLGMVGAQAAPEPKTDCSMFKKSGDGRWMSTIKSRIGNPKSFVTLEPGIPIARDTMLFGMNVSDIIDQACGK